MLTVKTFVPKIDSSKFSVRTEMLQKFTETKAVMGISDLPNPTAVCN